VNSPVAAVTAAAAVASQPTMTNVATPPAPGTTLQAAKSVGTNVLVNSVFGETNGGVTIQGYPTVESAADHITVDVGLVCSTVMQNSPNVVPPVTPLSVVVDIPGHQPLGVSFFVLRPPVVGIGVFTIPALPMTIVYAPPQGALKKNTVTYSDTATVSRTTSSSVTNSNNTKTVQAYSAADLIGKVAGAITTVAAVVGTGGAGAAGGASVAGALSQLGAALFGPAKDANDSTADATKQISSELSLVSGILTAVGEPSTSDSQTFTVQDDQSLTLTITNMSQYGSGNALGPGVGDRIVYLRDVKVVWMAVNGMVGIHVLGSAAIGANAVQDLMQEKAILQGGGAPTLGLDADTIDTLLSVDPIVSTAPGRLGWFGGPRIGPPRFVPADPAGRNGTTTSAGGDVFQASYDVATDSKHTVTSSTVKITDNKPGWGAVLFGASDNTETTTTSTFTSSQATDDKADDKVTSTITLVSAGHDDPYNVKIFYDRTFGTYCVVDANSPLLQSSGGVITVATGTLQTVQ
jgi:hypothetical protein